MEISCKVIQDSIAGDNIRITTFELEYPRFIHSELMTHRVFSRNAASSRAIPIDKMIEQVENDPAMPVHWGANKPGMQANFEIPAIEGAKTEWRISAALACVSARRLRDIGLHKQIVNRVLEPFQMMKTVVTATEFDNFFELRNHPDAQPEIHELAQKMYKLYASSKPYYIVKGEMHVPYVKRSVSSGHLTYWVGDVILTTEEAVQVSASCCAQVSYRLNDTSVEKAKIIYNKLVESKPIHASPFEHQARPSGDSEFHRNFRGWIQHREDIENND